MARRNERRDELSGNGYGVVMGDLDALDSVKLPRMQLSVLYYFAPPSDACEGDPRLAGFLSRIKPWSIPARVVYISTSGVYGDCGGEWVNEARQPNPQTERARRRWAAEREVTEWCARSGSHAVVLRVPGIYGPGRLPLDRIRRGIPVVRSDEAPFSNRIHADDLAEVCVASAQIESVGAVYNVSDGNPTTMTDYFFRLADAAGLQRPPEISMAEARRVLSSSMLSFLDESRRIDNRKMLSDLGVQLRYADLDVGLRASLGQPFHL
jgi:nucleoside-diphosphate-sugar epimerase